MQIFYAIDNLLSVLNESMLLDFLASIVFDPSFQRAFAFVHCDKMIEINNKFIPNFYYIFVMTIPHDLCFPLTFL